MEEIIVKGYKVRLEYDRDDNIWIASALAFPGCQTHGDSQADAAEEMKIAIDLQIKAFHSSNRPIPQPISIYA